MEISRAGTIGLMLAMGAALSGTQARAADCHFERVLSVSGEGSLNVGTGSGDLKVVPGDGSHVHIVGHARANVGLFGGSEGDVQHVCDDPPIQQTGNMVKVGQTHNPDWMRHVSVDYFIEVPRNFSVTAGSGSGDLELDNLAGTVVGTSGSGNVHASNLAAGAKLDTGSGDIVANGIGGDARLGTGSGSIQARLTGTGQVRATTGSGDIRLENVGGGLMAQTGSGTVEVGGQPRQGWKIGTGSGDVKLHVPPGTGFSLDAEASSGDIQTSLPLTMQGDLNKHHVRGAISGGGPEVRVETGSGDIRID